MAEDERFMGGGLRPEDDEVERSLRPRSLDDFVGQERVREQLAVALTAAKARGEALDHVLLAGPPGLGKTSLATIVREELGVAMRTVAGPALVGTDARRRRSGLEPAPPVSSRTTFSPRRTVPLSSLLSVSYSSKAWAIVCRSSRRSVRIVRARPSASSIRRRTSWSMICAVASETFCVCVTACPRKTSCSLA